MKTSNRRVNRVTCDLYDDPAVYEQGAIYRNTDDDVFYILGQVGARCRSDGGGIRYVMISLLDGNRFDDTGVVLGDPVEDCWQLINEPITIEPEVE